MKLSTALCVLRKAVAEIVVPPISWCHEDSLSIMADACAPVFRDRLDIQAEDRHPTSERERRIVAILAVPLTVMKFSGIVGLATSIIAALTGAIPFAPSGQVGALTWMTVSSVGLIAGSIVYTVDVAVFCLAIYLARRGRKLLAAYGEHLRRLADECEGRGADGPTA